MQSYTFTLEFQRFCVPFLSSVLRLLLQEVVQNGVVLVSLFETLEDGSIFYRRLTICIESLILFE